MSTLAWVVLSGLAMSALALTPGTDWPSTDGWLLASPPSSSSSTTSTGITVTARRPLTDRSVT
jgi:hypothetical protein